MTQYKSIAEWAQAVGSKAKTREGQRKAILASFKPILRIRIPLTDSELRWRFGNRLTRSEQYAAQHTKRLLQFGESVVRTEYPNQYPATRQDVEGFTLVARVDPDPNDPYTPNQQARRAYQSRLVVPLLELTPSDKRAYLGDWCIRCVESVSWDRDRYSKSWHRAYGGAKSVDSRTVLIRRVRPDGTLEKRDVEVSAWRGNYILNALVTAGVVESQKVPSALKPVQLHEAYTIRVRKSLGGIQLYERTLAGEHVDYCVLWHGLTYHAATPAACVKGLRLKMTEATRAKTATINAALGRSLGFCESGMQQFASDFGLNIRGSYTPEEIAEKVKTGIGRAAQYAAELRKLAQAVNYAIPAELTAA